MNKIHIVRTNHGRKTLDKMMTSDKAMFYLARNTSASLKTILKGALGTGTAMFKAFNNDKIFVEQMT